MKLQKRLDKIKAREKAQYQAKKAKAAKGDKETRTPIQRRRELERARYGALRKRAAADDKEAQSKVEMKANLHRIWRSGERQALIGNEKAQELARKADK